MALSVSLECGGKSSDNCTYLVQDQTNSPTNSKCDYTICPASTETCRIRFDFNVRLVLSRYHFVSFCKCACFKLFRYLTLLNLTRQLQLLNTLVVPLVTVSQTLSWWQHMETLDHRPFVDTTLDNTVSIYFIVIG